MLTLNRCHYIDVLSGLKRLETKSINCVITSPPYYCLRDYKTDPLLWPAVNYIPMAGLPSVSVPEWVGCLGLEPTPQMYIAHFVLIFREIWRVLRDDGTVWINIGDSRVGTGGDRGRHVSRQIFDIQQSRNLQQGRYSRNRNLQAGGLKIKDMVGIPWMLAFALQAEGFYLRQDIIWQKPNPMPESVKDRCTESHEYIFLLSKSSHYCFDSEAIKEPCVQNEVANGFRGGSYCNHNTFDNSTGGTRKSHGNLKQKRYGGRKYTENPDIFFRTKSGSIYEPTGKRNKRDVWTVATAQCKETHFATFPEKLILPCVLAGCPEGGTVLDPFMGSGTTLIVANRENRNCIGLDNNRSYCEMANRRRDDAMAQQSLFRDVI